MNNGTFSADWINHPETVVLREELAAAKDHLTARMAQVETLLEQRNVMAAALEAAQSFITQPNRIGGGTAVYPTAKFNSTVALIREALATVPA